VHGVVLPWTRPSSRWYLTLAIKTRIGLEGNKICGIVGAASRNLVGTEVKTFEDLMIVSNLRGKQGAGVIVVSEKKVHGVKSVGNGIDVIERESYRKLAYKDCSILVGHTRWPTKGGVDINAVHPHMFSGLAGVHNGTLRKVRNQTVPDSESDSGAIYKHINEVGVVEALKEAEGAYALVFIDYKTSTLNFIRNFARPLFFAKVNWHSPGRTLYWASEKAFLQLILGRNNIKHDIEELPVNELWQLPCKMDKDFTKTTGVYAGAKTWESARWKGGNDGEHWARHIPFSQSRQSPVSLASKVGPEFQKKSDGPKETFVVRDGIVIRKSDDKQVFLPRPVESDEQKGTEENEVSVHQAGDAGKVSDKQRTKADEKVSDRKRLLTSVPSVGIRQEEREFIQDNIDNLFDAAYGKSASETSEVLVETVKGHYVPIKEIRKVCQSGCSYCGDAWDYSSKLAWLDQTEFLCEPCQNSDEAFRTMYDFYPYAKIMRDWMDGNLKNVAPPPESWFGPDGSLSNRTPTRTSMH